MDGLLIVDKPVGPTSHDVVARVRRILGERRVGHTGTLDPMASGVLPLVVGRATRLAQFINTDRKTYEATLLLGLDTDTYDAQGQPVGVPHQGPWPMRAAIEAALLRFRGSFLQQPPAFSAKKIQGRRSYTLARRAASAPADATAPSEAAPLPAPTLVTAHAIELADVDEAVVRLRVTCSAGFYIRSLVHDLGVALGTGAHLTSLRRTASGSVTLDGALPLERLQAEDGAGAARVALIPMDNMLPALPSVALTADGGVRAAHGCDLGPWDAEAGFAETVETARLAPAAHIRLLDPAGRLVGVATLAKAPGFLHPAVVLM